MRSADSRDVSELAELEQEVFGDDAWSEDSLRQWITDGALMRVSAESHGGKIVAYAAFRSVVDEAELLRIGVRPGSRRSGLGRRLLQDGLAQLWEGGIEVCHLEVRANNLAARSLYRALGFEAVGRRPGYYRDGVDAELWTVALADPKRA